MMSKRVVRFFLVGWVLVSPRLWAQTDELPAIYKSARANSMGGVFVASGIADEAVFQNPAALAGKDEFSLQLGPAFTELGYDIVLSAASLLSLASSFSLNALNSMMGKNIYTRVVATPSFRIRNVAFSAIVDRTAALYIYNKAYPEMTFGYVYTVGYQFGSGFRVLGSQKNARSTLDLGLTVKYLSRKGKYNKLRPTDLLAAVDDPEGYLEGTLGEYGSNYGFDFGALWMNKLDSRAEWRVGAVVHDLTAQTFPGSNSNTILPSFHLGTSITYKAGFLDLIIAYDLQHITADTDFYKKNHYGLEVRMPILSVWAGFYQQNLAYGFGLNLWAAKVQMGMYTEELMTNRGLAPNQRYFISASAGIQF